MKFYHRTKEERWDAIRKDGCLWGVHGNLWEQDNERKYSGDSYRYTYLAPSDPGISYGDVLLEVDYIPLRKDFGIKHNYGFDPPPGQICWQFSVFEPIPLDKIKRLI